MLTFQCQNRWKRIGIISRKLAVASWNYSATKGVGLSPTQWFFTRTPPPQAPGAFSIGVGSRWSQAQVLPGLQVICIQHIKIPSCFHPPLGQVFCLAQKHCFTARLPLINLFEAELDFQGVLILHRSKVWSSSFSFVSLQILPTPHTPQDFEDSASTYRGDARLVRVHWWKSLDVRP